MRTDLSPVQRKTLALVEEKSRAKTEIRKEIGLSKPSFREMIEPLSEEDYIAVEKDPSDKRRHIVKLTEKAKKDQQLQDYITTSCHKREFEGEHGEIKTLTQKFGATILYAIGKIEEETAKDAKKFGDIDEDVKAAFIHSSREDFEKIQRRGEKNIETVLKELQTEIASGYGDVFGIPFRDLLDFIEEEYPEIAKTFEDCERENLPNISLEMKGQHHVEVEE